MPRNFQHGVYLATLLACLSVLSACIDSGASAPQSSLLEDEQLRGDQAMQAAVTAAAWPQGQWWQAYHDAQLNAWMDMALSDSPTLAMAAARVRQAQAMAGVVAASEAPQVGVRGAMERKAWPDDYFYGPGELASTSSWNNNAALQLSYDLDLWGRERSNSERALDMAQVAAVDARAAELDLQASIMRSYVRLALQFAEQDVASASVAQLEALSQLAQQRLANGLGTQLEVSEAQTPVLEAQRQLALVQQGIALSRNQLAALAGKGPGEGARLQRPTLSLKVAAQLPSSLPLELVGRRPDVLARRWQVAAQARGIEVAKADFYPNINLLGSFGWTAVQGGVLDFLKADKLTYGLGPALSLPIFDGGRLRAQLGAAAAGYDLAVEQYNQTLVQALQSIADPLVRLHSLEQQQALAEAALHSAEQAYSLAQIAYQRGLTDYRGVLLTQTQLLQQQLVQQRLLAAQLGTQAQLWVALGGAVMPPDVGPEAAQLQARAPALHLGQP